MINKDISHYEKKIFHNLAPLFGIFLFAVALWVFHRELREYHYHEVVRHLAEIPAHHLLLALAFTILNYLIMTGYDALALRYIRHPIAYIKIVLASFIGYAFSNKIGFSITLSFPGFLGIFLLAQFAGIAIQIPGGVGVFESVILLLRGDSGSDLAFEVADEFIAPAND